MTWFVSPDSIVRRIWGRSDTVMLIFAGAAAEFALNKAVDWLYFTKRLPTDPIGRLFSTVRYAQRIIFANEEEALRAIDSINDIHADLEKRRGARIPAWAYRDVLYMLIHYSQASFEKLEREMSDAEKEDLFDVFQRVGARMRIPDLPASYAEWSRDRAKQLQSDLAASDFTVDLFKQYRKHLGWSRYRLLREAQKLVVPLHARHLLRLRAPSWLAGVLVIYRALRTSKADQLLAFLALPPKYRTHSTALTVGGE